MKKIFLALVVVAASLFQGSFAQDSSPNALLSSYYSIKDALVSGNAMDASAGAAEFVKTISGVDENLMPAANKTALVKEARQLSGSKDIKQQRELFASFSNKMVAYVKEAKNTGGPVYQQYCPMKKASWLSNSKSIKNPYYGNAMLTCGKVAETFHP